LILNIYILIVIQKFYLQSNKEKNNFFQLFYLYYVNINKVYDNKIQYIKKNSYLHYANIY